MEENAKMSRFKKSRLLTSAAWKSLKMDKELVLLPFISFFASFAILMIGVVAALTNPGDLFYTGDIYNSETGATSTPLGSVGGILILLALAIVTSVFTGAVIYGAIERFNGGDPTIKSSLKGAWKRAGSLVAFSVFNFTIGFVLNQIASRIPFLGGKIVVWLANAAWGVASFFALPVIVTNKEPIGPVKATKKSIEILKKVWGESLIASVTIGLITLVSFLAYLGLIGAMIAFTATFSLPTVLTGVLGALGFIGLVGMMLVFSALDGYVKAAVYHYAVTGESPASFDKHMMQQAFTHKKARKIFGV